MKVRIGNQTSFLASPLLMPFEYAVASGFDAFEWFPDKKESGAGWTEDEMSKETRKYVRETASKHNIFLSVHAALPSHPGKGGPLRKCVKLARDIGAGLINIHFSPREEISVYAVSVRELLKNLSRDGIILSIENTIETTPEDINELFSYLAGHSSSVGMCLDLGHANLCRKTRNDYLKYVDLLRPEVPIIHIHMHENYGDYDSHLPIFSGPAGKDPSGIEGLIGRLKKRGFEGSIIFEQWPEPPDLLDKARGRLLGMIGNAPPDPERSPANCASWKDEREHVPLEGTPGHERDEDFAEAIAEMNTRFLSWRKRLEWVAEVLSGMKQPDPGKLVYLAIYLRFLGTGQIACGEDGGHYRPSNHARVGQRIYGRLAGMDRPEISFVLRKIYPWLPSFDAPFLRSEPLTRIRDIAHRSDIPRELKEEIKVTLQNKLHRSAGPEDLETSELLLKRITADTGLAQGFVKEFKVFHEELKEFFGARSLEEQLETFARGKGAEEKNLVQDFLESKAGARTGRQILGVLDRLISVRSALSGRLAESTGHEGHSLQLMDIALEDYSFVLLSRIVNYFEGLGDNLPWLPSLSVLSLAVANLRLSGFDREECGSLEAELGAWAESFNRADREHLLRIKATLDRCRRLADGYCAKILDLFPRRVERLGRALGVAERVIEEYSDADVRSHPIFQFSRLVKLVLRKVKSLAGLSSREAIVPGRVHGLAICALDMGGLPGRFSEPVIALLDKIEGDETIPCGMAGIIVGHETPFLSHLAVRARQRNVVFASCDDPDSFEQLKRFGGQRVVLDASSEKVRFESSAGEGERVEPKARHVCVKAAPLSGGRVLSLEEVTPETGGNKAFGVRRLREISARGGSDFLAPDGIVLPFGTMEEVLHSSPKSEREYFLLTGEMENLAGEDLRHTLDRVKEIILGIEVPREITSEVIKRFGGDRRLMVRSSSNCEDFHWSAGAGVYDSLANVPSRRVAEAIRTVWASLWNAAAFEERTNSGVPREGARMAVLVQEMIVPDYSCIMHTANPASNDSSEVLIECAVGLGEALASGDIPGSPYRMVFHKDSKKVTMLSFASFSKSVLPDAREGTTRKTLDYSKVGCSTNKTFRNTIAERLGKAGMLVEREMGGRQDIEGFVAGGEIFLVQCRPQQGI